MLRLPESDTDDEVEWFQCLPPAKRALDPTTDTCPPCEDQTESVATPARVHVCDVCGYETKQTGHLKRHKAFKHGENVVWFRCDKPDCDFKVKEKGSLKQHKANKHGENVVWFCCDQSDCDYKCKEAGSLKRHKAFKHGENVVWFCCDQPGCEYMSKCAGHLKQHKANRHDIGVVWRYCDQPDCEFKTKETGHLKQHKSDIHDIGTIWHKCDADPTKCTYQSKQSGNLYDHIRRVHARVYAQRKMEQEERVRRALLDGGWREWPLAETMPAVGYFRREKRIDFKCAKLESRDTWANIDFVLGVANGYIFLEVDENQHKYGYGEHLSCDMKRMACVMESLAVETDYNLPFIYWLRYNPHAWRVGGALRTVLKVEREARLVAWLERFEFVAPLGIGYAFYNCEEDIDEPGILDVLGNEEYNPQYAEVVDNLMGLDLEDVE
jgi:hypothetical protein